MTPLSLALKQNAGDQARFALAAIGFTILALVVAAGSIEAAFVILAVAFVFVLLALDRRRRIDALIGRAWRAAMAEDIHTPTFAEAA